MMIRTACEHCAVRNSALCRALPAAALSRMSRLAVRRRIAAGQVISIASPDGQAVATVISGVVKLVSALEDGRQQIVALQFPGDFLGDPFSTGGNVSAEAATDLELCQIGQDEFRALLDEHPGMQQLLARHTFAELRAARDWMLLLGRKTASERVASLFVLLASRHPVEDCRQTQGDGPIRFVLPVSRADIADFLGLTIETVSRQIHSLKDSKILIFKGQRNVTVSDMGRLRQLAEREAR
jgi:CRP/FNR family transcriptional regulator